MKVMVDILDDEYNTLSNMSEKEKVNELSYYERIIANGIPITDDCISREYVLNKLDTTELCLTDDWEVARHIVEDAPAIIEARGGQHDND